MYAFGAFSGPKGRLEGCFTPSEAFLMKETSVSVSLLGAGQVGRAFLKKLSEWEANEGPPPGIRWR